MVSEDQKGDLSWTGEWYLPAMDLNYDVHIHYERLHRYAFAALFVVHKNVLDLASGEGFGAYMLSKNAINVVGVDLDKTSVLHANSRYSRDNLRYINGSITDVPIEGKKLFDVVVCFEALGHVEDQEKVISEAKRLLKDDGIFIVCAPNKLIYSNMPESHNPSHAKNVCLEEFIALLSKEFSYNYIFGQHKCSGSNIWAMNPIVKGGARDFIIDLKENTFSSVENNDRVPRYFIVVSSNAYLNEIILNESHLIDVSDSFVHSLESKINENDNLVQRQDWIIEKLNSYITDKDSYIEDKDRELSLLNSELQSAVKRSQTLEFELSDIKESIIWQLLTIYHKGFVERVFPLGSKRLEYYNLLIRGGRVIIKEGLIGFVGKYKQYRKERGVVGKNESVPVDVDKIMPIVAALKPHAISPNNIHFITPRKFRLLFIGGFDFAPSNRYRVYNFEEYLSLNGIESRHMQHSQVKFRLKEIMSYDLIVLFRIALDENIDTLCSMCIATGIPVVYDVDDYVFEPKVASAEYMDTMRRLSKGDQELYNKEINRNRAALMKADYFTTSTEYLAARGRDLGKKSFVLRNGLSGDMIKHYEQVVNNYKKKDAIIRIGYFSGTMTHQKDFKVIIGPIIRILEDYPSVRLIIGGDMILSEFPELNNYQERIDVLPLVPQEQLPNNIITADINIAPLEVGNPFCESKSELKYFDAGLLNIPTIASGTDAFNYAIKDGVNGFIAKDEDDWYNKLKLLIDDKDLRSHMGKNAHQCILSEYSPRGLGKVLVDTYRSIIMDYRRQAGTPDDSLSIGIILTSPFAGSGDCMRIFELAGYLRDNNHNVKIYITSEQEFQSSEATRRFIENNFFDVDYVVDLGSNITSCDILLVTHWSTAYVAKENKKMCAKIVYFVQDYEPYFDPMSLDYVKTDLSFKMADVIVTYGTWCEQLLKRGNKVMPSQAIFSIPFYINGTIFHPNYGMKRKCNRIIYLARPGRPLYSLGIEALKIVSERMPDAEIIFYGSQSIKSSDIPFKHINMVNLTTQKELAKLYNSATVALVFTSTNLSMTSLEIMSCKCPVVDILYDNNVINYGGQDNAMLVDPVPEKVAEGILRLMLDCELWNKISDKGYKYVNTFPNMVGSFDILLNALRNSLTQ